MKIYVIRHGQTTFNKERRIAGQMDVPLNEEGLAQAKETAGKVPADCTRIISSDLVRCKQTTEALNEDRNLPVEYDARLRERDFGSLAGASFDDPVFSEDFWATDRAQKYDYRSYGGESVEDVFARLVACLADVREKGGKPLLVTSAGIILLLQNHLYGKAQEERVANSTVLEFEIPGTFGGK